VSGIIPTEVGKLTKLQHIDVHLNNLRGSSEAWGLAVVVMLRLLGCLHDNRASGRAILTQLSQLVSEGTIPVEFGELGNLRYLELSNNTLSGA
jgi:hypothetical protein